MKKYLIGILALAMVFASSSAFAGKVKVSDYPEKGWHKGPYLAATVGMVQVTNDKHIITNQNFNGAINPAFGLAFGWDIADWIGPLLQITYSTTTGSVGDVANDAAGGNTPTTYPGGDYPQYTFPPNTFPVQNARQHLVNLTLAAKATLPYFVHAEWQPKMVKILPFAKLGGTGYAMFVHAPSAPNDVGAFGGGPAIGLGCEFLVWKGFFFALDATENLIFQKSYTKSITATFNNVTQSYTFNITKGGFNPQFVLLGMFGWHF